MSKKIKKKPKDVWVIEQHTFIETETCGYLSILAVAKSKKKAKKYVKENFPGVDWFYDDATFMEGGVPADPGRVSVVAAYPMDVI